MKRILLVSVLVLLLLSLVILVGGFLFYQRAIQPLNPNATESVKVVIPRGASVLAIGQTLAEKGLIRHPQLFRLVVWQEGLTQSIQAGTFSLSPSQSVQELASTLTSGTEDVWITIPEGLRREEIAELLASSELEAFSAEEFLQATQDSEGQLFPDTYLLPRQATTQSIVSLLNNTFESKIEDGLATEIANSPHSLEDALIMASLVQRESSSASEMPAVAGVLWNRIELGMPLGVDATLQYIAGYDKATGRWWAPPDVAVKESTSLYNTYQYAGLPPAPIANPGLAAVQAALQPQASDYLYYIHANKQIYFARTLEEHNQNINRYLR